MRLAAHRRQARQAKTCRGGDGSMTFESFALFLVSDACNLDEKNGCMIS
jgi:hypothetical protein